MIACDSRPRLAAGVRRGFDRIGGGAGSRTSCTSFSAKREDIERDVLRELELRRFVVASPSAEPA